MTWFRLDDKFHSHPKVVALFDGDCPWAAQGVWAAIGSWCADHETDGVVPRAVLRRLGVPGEAISELVRVGLWVEGESGEYCFHDWHDYQPDSLKLESKRKVDRERKRSGRNPRGLQSESERTLRGLPPRARALPDPTRPVKLSNESSSESRPAADDVRRVFDHWVKCFWSGKGPRPKLDDKRRARIKARLKAFTADELCEAVSGAQGGWHAENGHTGIQTLLRDDEAVERHLGALAAKSVNGSGDGYVMRRDQSGKIHRVHKTRVEEFDREHGGEP